jgi:hypothetical protein
MSDLTDHLVSAGVASHQKKWTDLPGPEAAEDVTDILRAALRVLHDEGYHLVIGSRHLYPADLVRELTT